MLDVSWGEMMLIGAVALIVIGPKDLPAALRTLGQATTKLRRMASEFRGQFDEAMREAELDKVREDLQNVGSGMPNQSFNPIQTIRDEIKGAIENRSPGASAGSHAPTQADVPAATPVDLAPPPPPAAPLNLEEFKAPPKAEPAVQDAGKPKASAAKAAAAKPAAAKPASKSAAKKPKSDPVLVSDAAPPKTKPAKPKKSATP